MKLTTGYKKPIASSGTDALELSSNNSYLLLAGGGHKALSELVSPADLTTELSNYVTIGSNQTITGVKTFSLAINADITGNAATATNADKLDDYHLSDLVNKSGENLIIGTTNASTIGWNQVGWSGGISTYDLNNGVYKMWSYNGWHTLYYTLDSQYASKSVSFSFDIMFLSSESTEGPVSVTVGSANSYIGGSDYHPSTSDLWEHKQGTITLRSTPYFGIMIFGTDNQKKSCVYLIKNLKVELGNLPTIWTPAHADITWDNLTGKPSSLPADGGNADTVDGEHLYTRTLGVNGTDWTFASTLNANATTHIYAPITAGTSGQILKSTGGTPTWVNTSDISAGKLNGYTANDFIQNITVRNVITGAPGTNAEVKATKTNSDVILDFTIPRGYQGDMAEKEDSGYTDSNGDTVIDYCNTELKWQLLKPGSNRQFADRLSVPIPSSDMILSMIDCIKMTQDVTLSVGESLFNDSYTWGQLHWLLQCSNKDSVVYVTKYGTSHNDFPFGVDTSNNNAIDYAATTIEIVVRCEPDTTGQTKNAYYIQIAVENEYGRAYYIGSKVEPIVV